MRFHALSIESIIYALVTLSHLIDTLMMLHAQKQLQAMRFAGISALSVGLWEWIVSSSLHSPYIASAHQRAAVTRSANAELHQDRFR